MKVNQIVGVLILINFNLTIAQTQLSINECVINFISENSLDKGITAEIDDILKINNKSGDLLTQGEYYFDFLTEEGIEVTIPFTINTNGVIDGQLSLNVNVQNTNDSHPIQVYSINKGLVTNVKEYDFQNRHLEEEAFKKGDTVYTKIYNQEKQILKVVKTLNKKDIYKVVNNEFSTDGSVKNWLTLDNIKGIEETYENKILIFRLITKNLPEGIRKIKEKHTNVGVYKTEEIYGGIVKITQPDGTYSIETPIEGGAIIKKYDSNGALIDSEVVTYMMESSFGE